MSKSGRQRAKTSKAAAAAVRAHKEKDHELKVCLRFYTYQSPHCATALQSSNQEASSVCEPMQPPFPATLLRMRHSERTSRCLYAGCALHVPVHRRGQHARRRALLPAADRQETKGNLSASLSQHAAKFTGSMSTYNAANREAHSNWLL